MRTFAILAACFALVSVPAAALAAERCVTKAGSATGVTRGFAEYEAELIIRQVTGNWPIQSDRIGKPRYSCMQDGALWTCRAVARVCKGA
jgi:hypothetical protein